jgi:drug/metabolite transporter (DMT)-like permease
MLHEARRPLVLVGFAGTVGPMLLVAWAQQHVPSGTVAVLTAAAPLFVAVLAWFLVPEERVSAIGVVGLLTGFAGVVLLVGAAPDTTPLALLGSAATAGAAMLYGAFTLYVGARLSHVPADVITLGASGWGAVLGAPLAIADLPSTVPGLPAVASLVGLAVPGTALALGLYYALLAGAGASRTVLIQYLVPGVAVVFGALTLGERLTAWSTVGLLLVLAGVAVGPSRNSRSRERRGVDFGSP